MRVMQVMLAFLFFVCFVHNGRCIEEESIRFLGKDLSSSQWDALQHTTDCLATEGLWKSPAEVPHRPLHLTTACVGKITRQAACANTSKVNYQWELKPSRSCRWQENRQLTSLIEFTRESFCRVLQGHHVLAVGDSLTNFLGASLVNAFFEGLAVDKKDTFATCRRTCMHKCRTTYHFPCRALVNASFNDVVWTDVRNDHLTLVVKSRPYNATSNVLENAWVEYLRYNNGTPPVSLLMLNRGAHYVEDGLLIQETRKTLDWLAFHHANVSVIWRDTPRGHTDEERNSTTAPLTTPIPPTDALPYNWGDFHRQNMLIRELLRKFYRGVLYLDVATMTELRVDTHLDGLHYCVPGPQGSWLKLLVNVLLLLEDVTR